MQLPLFSAFLANLLCSSADALKSPLGKNQPWWHFLHAWRKASVLLWRVTRLKCPARLTICLVGMTRWNSSEPPLTAARSEIDFNHQSITPLSFSTPAALSYPCASTGMMSWIRELISHTPGSYVWARPADHWNTILSRELHASRWQPLISSLGKFQHSQIGFPQEQ